MLSLALCLLALTVLLLIPRLFETHYYALFDYQPDLGVLLVIMGALALTGVLQWTWRILRPRTRS